MTHAPESRVAFRLDCAVRLPADPSTPLDLRPLPAGPGVYVIEDERQRPLIIAVSADVRRRVRAKLAPEPGATRTPVDRRLARSVHAMRVGSDLEADWVYLALTRRRLPHLHETVLDRWRPWFIRVDPDEEFPRLAVRRDVGAGGVTFGPLPDRRSAQRVIDALESAFDLCRYHQILLEAPHGVACVYKEMGRCPAPCDGSVSLTAYRATVRGAIGVLRPSASSGLRAIEQAMRRASRDLAFEQAARQKHLLSELAPLGAPAAALLGPVDELHRVLLLPSERADAVRVFRIHAGRIEPWLEAPIDGVPFVAERIGAWRPAPGPPCLDDLAVLTRHLLVRGTTPAVCLTCEDAADQDRLRAAVAAVLGGPSSPPC